MCNDNDPELTDNEILLEFYKEKLRESLVKEKSTTKILNKVVKYAKLFDPEFDPASLMDDYNTTCTCTRTTLCERCFRWNEAQN